MNDIPEAHISYCIPFVVQHCVADLRVMKIASRVGVIFCVSHPDDTGEKSRIHYGSLTLWSLGGLREPEFVHQIIVDQLGPIDFTVLHR